jgi:hypothetical protein
MADTNPSSDGCINCLDPAHEQDLRWCLKVTACSMLLVARTSRLHMALLHAHVSCTRMFSDVDDALCMCIRARHLLRVMLGWRRVRQVECK